MVMLWLEAFKAALSDELGAGPFEDAIIYPRGGMLYKSWAKIKDFDLTFYFNDWAYQAYTLKNMDLPYWKIINAFIILARESGLSIVENCYTTERSGTSLARNNFSAFPVTVRIKNGITVYFHIFDTRVSMISPENVLKYDGLGFAYDPDGNYYGAKEAIEILNKYVREIKFEDLVEVKYRHYINECNAICNYINAIYTYIHTDSNEVMRIYRKPFVRAVTLNKIIGDMKSLEASIAQLTIIDDKFSERKFTFEIWKKLRRYYVALEEMYQPYYQNEAKIRGLIKRRVERIIASYPQEPSRAISSPVAGGHRNATSMFIQVNESNIELVCRQTIFVYELKVNPEWEWPYMCTWILLRIAAKARMIGLKTITANGTGPVWVFDLDEIKDDCDGAVNLSRGNQEPVVSVSVSFPGNNGYDEDTYAGLF
ncbi:MAG TPA: hypothetical protein DEA99_08165, partial [Candidatus Omnitrophica bacterium]|nr:hypothetical protein [Candidatus Omnitrophota bacterium]